jgi:hemoglobin
MVKVRHSLSSANRTTQALLLCCMLVLTGCGNMTLSDRTLYEDLGQQQGISEIVDLFILEIANDERVLPHFADSNVQRFREMVIEHFCMVADGPCEYTGDSMIDVHAGMQINSAEFNAVVENLITAMDLAGTPIGAQNRLLERLSRLRSEIIHI